MIREAKETDIPAIQAMMRAEPEFWQEAWRVDVLDRALEAAAGLAFVSIEGGKVVGFICGHDLGFRAYLSELIVSGPHKHHGIGTQLLDRLESELTFRGCSVLISDVWKNTRGFYEGQGWSSPDVVLLRKKLNITPTGP